MSVHRDESSAVLTEAVRTSFGGARALVVGDLMLDRYMWGEVARISPEAPVPVVRLTAETERPGGAANVAANLTGLGLKVAMAGFVGADGEGDRLLGLLQELGADTTPVIRTMVQPTVTKTRVISAHQQMLRLDRESAAPLSNHDLSLLLESSLRQVRSRPAAVIISDYAKGVVAPMLCQRVIAEARGLEIPVLVDPKGRDYTKYAGATAVTPNRAELGLACGLSPDDLDELLKAGEELRHGLHLDFLAFTRGEEGISIIEPGRALHVAAVAKRVFDVSGAGDTVIATLAAGLVAGLDRLDAVRLANLAAGVVVGKVGTVPIQRNELLEALSAEDALRQASKICSAEEILKRAEHWRASGERIVFTNGCFDLLHVGHVTYLERARREGDRLVVALNTDRSVRTLKGPSRPIIPEQERARVLAALECVDAVVLFDQETPLDLISRLRPEVLAKGSDYREDQVVGAQEIKAWKGRLALIPLVDGYSSSGILKRITARQPDLDTAS